MGKEKQERRVTDEGVTVSEQAADILLEAQPSAKKHRTEESESRPANKPLVTHVVTVGNPPHPSVFDAFGPEGEWTKERWNIAAEAAIVMPEPCRTQLLDRCPPSALRHLLSCRRYVTPVPRTTHLSPTDYFVKCIQRNPSKAISVTHYCRYSRKCVSNYAASERAAKRFNERNVFSDCCEVWRAEQRLPLVNPKRRNSFTHAQSERVQVVTGESGSGKTTWALTSSSVGIYLTPDDFNAADLARINGYDGKHSEVVCGMVKAAMTAVMDGVLDFSVKPSGETIDVLVVLDDFVEHHRFVRELTNACLPPCEELFNFDVKLTFIVIGSIADAFSHHCTIISPILLSMPSSLSMLEVITDAVERRCGPSASTLIKAIKGHSLAMLLIQNARFAAVLTKRLVALWDDAVGEERDDIFVVETAVLSTLDTQIPLAASDCLRMSTMCSEDATAVATTCARAMALRLRGPLDVTPLSLQEAALTDLLRLVTDQGYTASDHFTPSGYIAAIVHGWSGEEFRVPKSGRYEMSMAQYLLCRMHYGLKELTDAPSWRRYEVIVAEYVADLIRGLNTRTLGDLMMRLGVRSIEGPDQTICYKSVDVVHRERQSACFDASSDSDRAHVMIGAPGSPCGEVVVILPHVAVISIECKYCVDDGAPPRGKTEIGKSKTSLMSSLRKFVKVPGGERYFRVHATIESGERERTFSALEAL